MAATGIYVGVDSATLATMLTEAQAARTACLKGMQSYSQAGRSASRVQFNLIQQELAEILYAQGVTSGQIQRMVYADMSNLPG